MYVINIDFVRIRYIAVDQLLGAIGVYVIWDSQSEKRPTYIGEGTIVKRLHDHSLENKFARPVDGYLGILNEAGEVRTKRDAVIIEVLLLACAQCIDKWPNLNKHPGRRSEIYRVFRNQECLRINLRGFDPFLHPNSSKDGQSKVISVYSKEEEHTELTPFEDDFGPFWWRCPWRMRRH